MLKSSIMIQTTLILSYFKCISWVSFVPHLNYMKIPVCFLTVISFLALTASSVCGQSDISRTDSVFNWQSQNGLLTRAQKVIVVIA